MGKRLPVIIIAVLVCVAATAVRAGDPAEERGRVVVIGDGDETVTVTMEDGALTVTREEGGSTSVHMVDMTQVGALVGEALADLDEHLALLADLQLDVHMGSDNRLNVSWEDETFEVDVNEIMVQVSEALSAGFDEFETGDWSSVHARDRGEDELRRELRELKAEMRQLRRELHERDTD
jgi:hypothetical protein